MADRDRETDSNRLDEAIEAVLYVLRLEFPVPAGQLGVEAEDDLRTRALLLGKNRCEAAKALVLLLERRAKLLGLDLAGKDAQESPNAGSLAAVERRLEVVGKVGKGG